MVDKRGLVRGRRQEDALLGAAGWLIRIVHVRKFTLTRR